MVPAYRIFSLSLFTLALGLASSNIQAANSGKIYLGDRWVDSESFSSSTSSALPGFGPLSLQGGHEDHRNDVLAFLRGNTRILGELSQISWSLPSVQVGTELETHRVKKIWNGFEVLGGEALVHLKQGKVAFANGDATTLDHLSIAPLVSAAEAGKLAFSSYRGSALKTSAPELKVIVLGQGGEKVARLVYSVQVVDSDAMSSDVHFIDAYNGQEAMVTTNVQTIANRRVLSATGSRVDMETVTDANAEQLIGERFKTVFSDSGCAASGGFSFWENWRTFF